MTAPLRRTGYYFCLSVVLLQLLLFLSGSRSLALAQLPPIPARLPGQRGCLHPSVSRSGGGKHPRGSPGECLGRWGRVPGQSSRRPVGCCGSATALRGRAGPASSPAVANAWHSSCISGSVPRERGNQKYLLQREAQRASGTYPAPSDEAAPRLWPEKP